MAWYNPNWTYRIKIIVAAAKVQANENDFVVPVVLNNAPSSVFSNVHSSGKDFRVTRADGTTECEFQLSSLDTGTETGLLFFLANNLSSSVDTVFYLYYGNASAVAYGVTDTFGRNNTWADSALMWHLGETSGNRVDSVGSGADLVPTGVASVAGKAGNATSFDGTNDKLQVSNAVFNPLISDLTFSFWMKRGVATAGSNGEFLLERRSTAGLKTAQWSLYLSATDKKISLASTDGVSWYLAGSNTSILNTNWNHVAIVHDDGTNIKFYLNGVLDATVPFTTGFTAFNHPLVLGAQTSDTAYFNGNIDEFRIRDSIIDADRIKTEFNSLDDNSNFLSFGSQETETGGSPAFIPQIITY